MIHPDSEVHGTHLGPVGPRWAPCWPYEPCYQGSLLIHEESIREDQPEWLLLNGKKHHQGMYPVSTPHHQRDGSPDSKVHGPNMGPIWGRQDPGGPHVGPMNLVSVLFLSNDFAKHVKFHTWVMMWLCLPILLIHILFASHSLSAIE